MTTTDRPFLLPAAVLAIGIAVGVAVGGLLAGHGIVRAKAADRYVTVKGVSEREARADLAIWPLRLVASDNDLARANAQLQQAVGRINSLGGGPNFGPRYVINQTLLVRSTEPEVVLAASQRVSALVAQGVPLTSGAEYGGGGPTFVFTGLNALKPAMIAEATARAREAAAQFARDAGSALGGIRQANQGYFEILPRDQAQGITEASQVRKTIRVVATVEYLLDD